MGDVTKADSAGSLLARAMARLKEPDLLGGAALLEKSAKISNAPEVWNLLGIVWGEAGEKVKARDCFLKLIELKSNDPRAWVQVGATELDLGLFSEAVAHYKQAMELAPERADLRIWLANAYDRAGRLSDALEEYQKAEALEPTNPEVFFERALAYRNHGRFAEAERDFRRTYHLDQSRENALELARNMAIEPHLKIVNSGTSAELEQATTAAIADAEQRDDYASAIVLYDLAIASSPGNAINWNNRGWAKYQSGDLNAALTDFERAITLQPDYLQARVNLSEVLKRLGRLREATQAQRKIIEVDPAFAHGHYNLGATLMEMGEFESALASIERAIEIDGNDADYFILHGIVLESLERKCEALSEFTWASNIDETKMEAYFLRGNMQFDLGRLQIAIADYTLALELNPSVATIYLNRGLCYAALERDIEARNDLENALKLKPGIGIAHLRLGQVARRQNRLDEAEQHFKWARSLGFTEVED
jgi:tetratricopeptide (TPR) repeat protein